MEGMADYSKSDRDSSIKGQWLLLKYFKCSVHWWFLNSFYLDEMDDDDGMIHGRPDDADSSPFWQLLEAVESFTDNQGNVLCEPFMKLPSRRRYSDYYLEIKKPIALERIRAKVAREDYASLNEMAADLALMFENAKHYNRPDSKIFKDAVKLQKFTQSKVQELCDDDVIHLLNFTVLLKLNSSVYQFQSSEGEIEYTPKRKGRPRIHPIKSTPKSASVDTGLRKRMRQLYRCLMDFVMDDGRQPIQVFMEKPSKKLYPDYYRVISEPIDMITIDSNIKNDR